MPSVCLCRPALALSAHSESPSVKPACCYHYVFWVALHRPVTRAGRSQHNERERERGTGGRGGGDRKLGAMSPPAYATADEGKKNVCERASEREGGGEGQGRTGQERTSKSE